MTDVSQARFATASVVGTGMMGPGIALTRPRPGADLVRQGHLEAKTERGFYDWPVKSADAVRARRDAFLVEVLRYRRSQS